VALFVGCPGAFSAFLFLEPGSRSAEGARLSAAARAALGLLGTAYGVLAAGLLLAPAPVERRSPFAFPGLSGHGVPRPAGASGRLTAAFACDRARS
jgi:hypothetical protein